MAEPIAGGAARLPDLLPGERSDALSIAALYGRVQGALARALPRGRPLWVRGEIQSVSDRTGHCYIDLVDPRALRGRDTPVLKVICWSRTWAPLKTSLDRQGIVLEPGMVITLEGRVELYPPRGQLNFIATGIDVTALLGQVAARRAALLKALELEGLLQRNRAVAVPAVPLRVGLVASKGTEGYRDFTGQLLGSGFGFTILHAAAKVQGAAAPNQIVASLSALFRGGCDLVVVVRGGGSKGDLAAFDSEPVARAIAMAPVPVWTGIGHTGDQSVADVVANRAFVTPTECGQEIVSRVSRCWEQVSGAGVSIAERASEVITDALQRDTRARSRLCASARHQLDRHAERLQGRSSRASVAATRCLATASESLSRSSSRIGPITLERLQGQTERVMAWRRLLAAYDVERQLERGYSITLDDEGRLVRSVSALAPGAVLATRFADGTARSEVTRVELRDHEQSDVEKGRPLESEEST